ncbi:MAG: hypothetical protein II893_01505 [Methanomicrobium sp.]|nr:hypothetical protein [Methanomicrobium sp.]
MMISPETYVHFSLEGKSEEEADREVKKLRREISYLKRVIEESPEVAEMMDPSDYVKLGWNMGYLDAAKEYFESQGWEYKPSRAEIADKKFNDRLKDLESIEIEYGTGFLEEGEIRKIEFDNEKILTERFRSYMIPINNDNSQKIFDGMNKSDLLDKLAEIHIGEWKRKYYCIALDGYHWHVVFRYSDGKKCRFEGSNSYPYNFDAFLYAVRMKKLDEYEE